MQNYPFYGVVTHWSQIILAYWITSEMVMTLARDPQCLKAVEAGSQKAEYNEMMKASPEGF